MLQSIRESTSGPFAWIVVAIITVPFAFFGIETFRSGGGDATVAKVGDEKITQRELQLGYEQRYQRLQQMMGESFDPSLIQGPQFRRTVLEDMVREQVITSYVEESRLRGTDAAVLEYLRQIPAFQVDGEFSPDAYRDTLAANRRQPDAFEAQVADSIATEQLQLAIGQSALVAPGEVELAYRMQHQRRRFSQVTFTIAEFRDEIEVTDAEIQARYDSQSQRYTTPEQIKLAYIEVNQSQLTPEGEPDEAALRAVYEDQRGRFTTVEARRTSHILIKAGERSSAEAQRLAEEARARIVDGGESFESVARELSEDGGSAQSGGDLDWVERGVMVPEFEDALFAMSEGEVSEPVETDFGWHIIKLESVRPETTKPFDDADVQARIREIYLRDAAAERFQALTEELETLAYESLDSLEPAAEVTGLSIEETEWFSRNGGAGIASNDDVIETAFSPIVLEEGENSRLIEIEPGRVVVVRVSDRQPEASRPLDAVREEIRAELVNEAAAARASEQAEALLVSLKDTGALETAIQAQNLDRTIVDSGLIERTDVEGREGARLSPRVVRTVFAKPRDAAGQTEGMGKLTVAGGDVVVYALEVVEDPRVPESGSERQTVADRASALAARQELAAWEAAIRAQTKVKIYEDALAQQIEESAPPY
ncbi:MAG: SurA N-terminal domain-containing protein [Pseudomonadota bacterium]|nr:SurA N-terminal domain-containing protein [Pseudomonadota bacterium]